jgi:serine/threonine protein kinase
MPRPISSDRHIKIADIETETVALSIKEEATKLQPLRGPPDYLSITWLASRLAVYGELRHLSSGAVKGVFPIGEGATFAVYRTLPRKDILVVKRPLLSIQSGTDEKIVFRQLYSLQLELRVLTDSQTRSHPNIIKLRAVIWEEHPDDAGRYWPSLVMEYANLGTLSNFLHRDPKPTFQELRQICHGAGTGLHFLHKRGIVHGDVNCNNVLLVKNEQDGSIVPKLGDFGFAVLDGEGAPIAGLGTHPFKAPELEKLERAQADPHYADTYSFGLLVWEVCQEGKNPFENHSVCSFPIDSIEGKKCIQALKKTDALLEIAIKSLSEEKKCVADVFQCTIRAEARVRDLEKALIGLGKGMAWYINRIEDQGNNQSNRISHEQVTQGRLQRFYYC